MARKRKPSVAKSTEPKQHQVVVELPEILDKVQYVYTNHARISFNKWDVRIAFGEIGPIGQLEPKMGVVLPHLAAKGLQNALTKIIKMVEDRSGEIIDPDSGNVEIRIAEPAPSKQRSKKPLN